MDFISNTLVKDYDMKLYIIDKFENENDNYYKSRDILKNLLLIKVFLKKLFKNMRIG